jgi:hypothetical protein
MSRGFDWFGGDGNGAIDFVKAKGFGMRFGIRKLTQPPYGKDGGFDRDWQGMRDAGIARFLYIFNDARRGAASAMAQIENAASFLGPRGLEPEDGAPCFDIEFPHGLPRSRQELAAFYDEVAAAIRTVFGCDGIPYSSQRVVDTVDTDTLGDPSWTLPQTCPLWVKTGYRLAARSPIDPVTPTGMPRSPRAWIAPSSPGPWIHQYQGDAIGVPGFAGTVDVNRFLHLSASTIGPADTGRIAWVRRQLQRFASRTTPSAVYFTTDASGWDAELERAVRDFQTANRLGSDGDIGPATFARLSRL